MFKYSHNLLPRIVQNFFTTNRAIHNYPTRNANKLRIPLARTTIADKFIKKTGVGLWNDLDATLTRNLKIGTFKIHLKKILIANY